MTTERIPFKLSWRNVGAKYLPFADAATAELPLGRLLRLSLFQVAVGMATVLLIGTLNRVMIVELHVSAWMVALMVSLPLLFAPFRALIGFRSDNHRSVLGLRRVPYIWMGATLQFGGFAMMPFALIILSGASSGPPWVGTLFAALAFLMVGAGLHTVQTVGLALATDLSPREQQPKVVALLSFMLLAGMALSAILYSWVLSPFSPFRLVQVIQATAVLTLVLNLVALWKQEPRNKSLTRVDRDVPGFGASWRALRAEAGWERRLVAIGLGAAGFSMQDVLLEPYGAQLLQMSVGVTTLLTALFAGGGIVGFVGAARWLGQGVDPHRLAASGALAGAAGFVLVIAAAPMEAAALLAVGTVLLGFGSGLFTVGTLTSCMQAAKPGQVGLALGAWGAVQATCAGLAIAVGGGLRDVVSGLAEAGALGVVLRDPATGYAAVYLLEIVLLFATIAAVGPLVRRTGMPAELPSPSGVAGQAYH